MVNASKALPARGLGAHLSTRGGWEKMLARARALGCTCVQIFASNPRSWKGRPVSRREGERYRRLAPAFGVRVLMIHAIYLVNLASSSRILAAKSFQAVRRDLISGLHLGAKHLILHPGTQGADGRGEKRLITALKKLQKFCPPGMRILLESMAGLKNSLGDLTTLGRVIRQAGPGVGVCLDSAHLCAAGYDVSRAPEMRRMDRMIRRELGYARIGCLHLNDSRHPCGSCRDRHENLGEGYVGREGLARWLAHPPLRNVPVIIETPGFNEEGPDRKNMRRLRQWAGEIKGQRPKLPRLLPRA